MPLKFFSLEKTTAIESTQPASSVSLKQKFADFGLLTKYRLSSSVVFSAMAGYLLGTPSFVLSEFIILILGGFFVTGAANAYNQIMEKDRDALMVRTMLRPLPSGRMSVVEALVIATLCMSLGLGLLYTLNPLSAGFGTLSILIYVLAYTPMKAKTPWAVFVGAIPGAIPFMLGWVAATNDFDIETGTLFAIQFVWQFPHFWAIGWLAYDDYKKAGYFLLPNRKKDKMAAFQALIYSVWLLFISIIPVFGFTGTFHISWVSAAIIFLLGVYLIYKAYKLYTERTNEAAKGLMLGSIMFLTLIQIIYVIDKYVQ